MEDIVSNWEEIADNSTMLDKQLEKLRLEKAKQSASKGEDPPKIRILTRAKPDTPATSKKATENLPQISQPMMMVDSTREESLRSQYVPPVRLLARPKPGDTQGFDLNGAKSKNQQAPKTLEQREKEYREARKRILGDVTFDEPEDESAESDGSGMSPAEVLKQKIAQAMKEGDGGSEEDGSGKESSINNGSSSGEAGGGESSSSTSQTKSKSRGKKNREKFKTSNPESPRDFPVPKTESDRILRQPRGPDGTIGFNR